MAKSRLVPFDTNGEMIQWTSWREGEGDRIRWKENKPFKETLLFSGYSRGRSSITMEFKCPKGKTYHMFVSDFSDVVSMLKEGVLEGTFQIVKKGANYGVQMQ